MIAMQPIFAANRNLECHKLKTGFFHNAKNLQEIAYRYIMYTDNNMLLIVLSLTSELPELLENLQLSLEPLAIQLEMLA